MDDIEKLKQMMKQATESESRTTGPVQTEESDKVKEDK
jgi:hypothetical protein